MKSGPLLNVYLFKWVAILACVLVRPTSCLAGEFVSFHENVLGTSLELRIAAESELAAQQAESLALTEIDRLTAIFSSYDPSSELSRFSSLPIESTVQVSPELFAALRRCDEWSRLSHGAFNPAVELLTKTWFKAQTQGNVPSGEELALVVRQVSQQHWRLTELDQNATRCSNVPLSLNAIAKGIILDRVCDRVLHASTDIQGVMVNIGGDLRVAGQLNQKVSIADPRSDALSAKPLNTVVVGDAAMATSGNSERSFQIGQQFFSHIIDPRNGQPVCSTISASVIAEDAETADALATICNVLPVSASLALVNSLPNVDCLLVTASGTILSSLNWPGGIVGPPAAPNQIDTKAESTGHSLSLEFEINKADNSARFRRPYVAAWVEDKAGFPVKTLSLFLMANDPGPRWHRDLRRWYAGDQMRKLVDEQNLIGTISKPTRNPGSYKVAWDGRDDNGKLLKAGKYTLYLEAAREHGTYQLTKFEFEFDGQPFSENLKGNVEIKSASFRYEKK